MVGLGGVVVVGGVVGGAVVAGGVVGGAVVAVGVAVVGAKVRSTQYWLECQVFRGKVLPLP